MVGGGGLVERGKGRKSHPVEMYRACLESDLHAPVVAVRTPATTSTRPWEEGGCHVISRLASRQGSRTSYVQTLRALSVSLSLCARSLARSGTSTSRARADGDPRPCTRTCGKHVFVDLFVVVFFYPVIVVCLHG